MLQKLLADGYHPIVFCRYIPTAEYLAEHLRTALTKKHKDFQSGRGHRHPAAGGAGSCASTPSSSTTAPDCSSPPTACPKASTCRTGSPPSSTTTSPGTPPATNSAKAESTGSARARRPSAPSPTTARTTASTASSSTYSSAATTTSAEATGCRSPSPSTPPPSCKRCGNPAAARQGHRTARTRLRRCSSKTLAEAVDVEWVNVAEREKASRSRFRQAGINPRRSANSSPRSGAPSAARPTPRPSPAPRCSCSALPHRHRRRLHRPHRHPAAGGPGPTPATKDGTAALPPLLPGPAGDDILNRVDPAVEALSRYILDAALDPHCRHARPARRAGIARRRPSTRSPRCSSCATASSWCCPAAAPDHHPGRRGRPFPGLHRLR